MGMFSLGKNSSRSSSSMNQDVFGGQNFQDMYGHFGNQYQNMMPYANMGFGMMPRMQNQMQDVFNSGYGGMQNQMSGGSYGDTSRYNDQIYNAMNNPQQSNQSMMYENIIGGPGNTYADPLVDAMRQGSNERREMVQSGTGLDASAMGQSGSSRHAMENAMTNDQFDQNQMLAESGIRENNYGRDMGWKMGIAQQADMNRQNDLNRAMQMVQGGNQAQQFGMGYGGQAQNLSMGYMAPWMQAMQGPWQNMQNYSSAMGDPTVLTDATSSGKSSGWNFGASGGS